MPGYRSRGNAAGSGANSRSLPQGVDNTLLKVSRRIVAELLRPNVRLKLEQPRMSFGAGGTGCEMVLDLRLQTRIQLTVEVGLYQITRHCTFHLEYLVVRAVTQSSRRLRARDSRDMTVPIGTL